MSDDADKKKKEKEEAVKVQEGIVDRLKKRRDRLKETASKEADAVLKEDLEVDAGVLDREVKREESTLETLKNGQKDGHPQDKRRVRSIFGR
jgi:hypothetical protein